MECPAHPLLYGPHVCECSMSHPIAISSLPIPIAAASVAGRFRPVPATPRAAHTTQLHLLLLLSRFNGVGYPRSEAMGGDDGADLKEQVMQYWV